MKIATVLLVALATILRAGSAAADKPFPVKLIIPAKPGGVVFFHFAHAQRAKFECDTCHATLWTKDAGTPVSFRAEGHQAAVSHRTSCGSCHRPAGKAFATEGNCGNRCHTRYAGDSTVAMAASR